MTASTRTASPATTTVPEIVRLLERSFALSTRRNQSPGEAYVAGVPAQLWDDALLDPLREFIARPSKGFRGRLVELGYQLAGGSKAVPRELPVIIESLHAGSLIVDDIEDESEERRAAPCLHRAIGVPLALNAGNFLYFWPQVLLARSGLGPSVRLRAHERLAHCLMRCHQGQALDLSVRVDELEQADVSNVVDAIATLKTGGLLGLAMGLGALAAGADDARTDAIAAFGTAVGVGLQMLDDMSGIQNPRRRAKAYEDLEHARATFVWALLADELDAAPYELLRREFAGWRAHGTAEAWVERLRFRLGASGTRRVRAHFAEALEGVRAAIGDSPLFAEFAEELVRLERSYVEA
jgi:geranylgeranyl pyrophosphate synthase